MKVRAILMVCMGNICRSPLAEGFARTASHKAGASLRLDSAGTHDYHIGRPPDPRARAVAQEFGCDIDDLRARQVTDEDFLRFDLILVADRANLQLMERRRPSRAHAELAMLLPWCGSTEEVEVPDPYYGEMEDFRRTAHLLRNAMPSLLRRVQAKA
ncbi:low molecular weight phosphotyrosine protein phosphatase [Xanthomonadaceae bacterium JHOS43]|nr:low molecular weight phosphotyrosine protein phosphatase [Xanthomonadaceae bacterium JHOS43]